ncbi:MAG: hypothetical protein AAFP00_06030 [Bacteroidota bacterium]
MNTLFMDESIQDNTPFFDSLIFKNIAHILGEDIASNVAIVKMELGRDAHKAHPESNLGAIIGNLHATLEKIRLLAKQIYPQALEQFGLEAAIIGAELDKWAKVQVEGNAQALPSSVALLIFRLIQIVDQVAEQHLLPLKWNIHVFSHDVIVHVHVHQAIKLVDFPLSCISRLVRSNGGEIHVHKDHSFSRIDIKIPKKYSCD